MLDPNSLHSDEGYQNPDFKVILVFTDVCCNEECGSHKRGGIGMDFEPGVEDVEQKKRGLVYDLCKECQQACPEAVNDWKIINAIMEKREAVGQIDAAFGKQHMFPPIRLEEYDFQETIDQGADVNVYGRYTDIENLGFDVDVPADVSFKSSMRVVSSPGL